MVAAAPSDVGQVDRLAEAQLARRRAGAVDRRVDDEPGWVWKAPMSGRASRARSRAGRWSAPMAVPWPMAGLPGSRAMVWVGPP